MKPITLDDAKEYIQIAAGIIALGMLFLVLPFAIYHVNKDFHHVRIENIIKKGVKAECLK